MRLSSTFLCSHWFNSGTKVLLKHFTNVSDTNYHMMIDMLPIKGPDVTATDNSYLETV